MTVDALRELRRELDELRARVEDSERHIVTLEDVVDAIVENAGARD